MSKTKAILFDMDGVLINTEPLHYRQWKEICRRRGVDIEYEVYKGCIGATIPFLFDLLTENYGLDLSKEPDVRKEAAKVKADIIEREGFPIVEGVKDMLKRMKDAGYIMAIASSSPPSYIRMAMEYLGAADYFSVLNSAENLKHSKPAPDIYLDTMEKLSLNAEECIVVEDSENGLKSAKAAGIRSIGFYNPDSGNQDLSLAECIIDSMDALTKELIESI